MGVKHQFYVSVLESEPPAHHPNLGGTTPSLLQDHKLQEKLDKTSKDKDWKPNIIYPIALENTP